MRSKKAIINSLAAIISQIISIICGFILPRLILSAFGSSYNGITSSITQFISCVVLLRAGVGGVTRAALYKPLADNDIKQISSIVRATEMFMKKVSLIFAMLLIVFACIYPFIVIDEFDWFFSFSLVIILGISTFAQNYFGITYQILIQADQRQYIYSIVTVITILLNTLLAAILITCGASIHEVKFASSIVFALNPILLNIYVNRKYNIDKTVIPNYNAISQRWDAFAQQVAAFINNNTDIIILTIFCNIKEVSVYTVYYLVGNGLYKIENTLCDGMGAAFGNMLAKNEHDTLQKNIRIFEFIVFTTSAFLFICGGALIVPFSEIYTKGISDVSYSRSIFGILMCINQFLLCVRLPYQMIVEAAGHFKQTKKGAILECFLNIIISVLLVMKFGLIGVTVGTFCALAFRTFQYAMYASKRILGRKLGVVVKHLIISFFEAISVVIVLNLIPTYNIDSYMNWFIYAIIVSLITVLVIFIYSSVFYWGEAKLLIEKIGKISKVKRSSI